MAEQRRSWSPGHLSWGPSPSPLTVLSQGTGCAASGDCLHDSWGSQALDPSLPCPQPEPCILHSLSPPQSVFEADLSELILCQNEVDLALRNLPTWMKDEPVTKNLVSLLAGGGGRSMSWGRPSSSSSPGLFPTLTHGDF